MAAKDLMTEHSHQSRMVGSSNVRSRHIGGQNRGEAAARAYSGKPAAFNR